MAHSSTCEVIEAMRSKPGYLGGYFWHNGVKVTLEIKEEEGDTQ